MATTNRAEREQSRHLRATLTFARCRELRQRYAVANTERTMIRTSAPEYRAEVALEAQAADGMRLERSYPVTSNSAAGLGSAEVFHHGVLEALDGLHQLRDVPAMTDEYHGPVLFAGNAAARSFDEHFARAVVRVAPAARIDIPNHRAVRLQLQHSRAAGLSEDGRRSVAHRVYW